MVPAHEANVAVTSRPAGPVLTIAAAGGSSAAADRAPPRLRNPPRRRRPAATTAAAPTTTTTPPVTGNITGLAAASLTDSFNAVGAAFTKAN
jgi:hypothetical protein